jgi:hypothetical protein
MHETEVMSRTEYRQPTTQAYCLLASRREQFSLIREMGLNCTTNLKTSVQQSPLKWTLARDVDRQPSLLHYNPYFIQLTVFLLQTTLKSAYHYRS